MKIFENSHWILYSKGNSRVKIQSKKGLGSASLTKIPRISQFRFIFVQSAQIFCEAPYEP